MKSSKMKCKRVSFSPRTCKPALSPIKRTSCRPKVQEVPEEDFFGLYYVVREITSMCLENKEILPEDYRAPEVDFIGDSPADQDSLVPF